MTHEYISDSESVQMLHNLRIFFCPVSLFSAKSLLFYRLTFTTSGLTGFLLFCFFKDVVDFYLSNLFLDRVLTTDCTDATFFNLKLPLEGVFANLRGESGSFFDLTIY